MQYLHTKTYESFNHLVLVKSIKVIKWKIHPIVLSYNIVKKIGLSTIVTIVWPKLLIETKKWELLHICKHGCNGLSRPPNLNFENCSKFYVCFNPLSINQIKKNTILGPSKN
jgi:hypothetical protein